MKRLILCAVLLFPLTRLCAQVPFWAPPAGLVAIYPFDGNTHDLTGFVNHGTPYSISYVTDRFGNANSAVEFNGINSSIEIQDNASIRSRNLTLAAWVKPYSADFGTLFMKCNKTDGDNEAYVLDTDVRFSFKQNSNCLHGAGWVHHPFNSALQVNRWQFVVSTYNGDTVANYIDDNLVSKFYSPGGIEMCVGGYLRLGYAFDGDPQAFSGAMDDVAVYNRALNVCEIHRLYVQNHTGIFVPPADVSVKPGETVSFSISTVGIGLSFLWEENSGAGYSALTDGGKYSGVNTTTLTISNVTPGMSGFQYRCLTMLPDQLCTEASNGATLKVSPAGPLPPIVNEAETLACEGQIIQFGSHQIVAPGTYMATFRPRQTQDSIVYLTVKYQPSPNAVFDYSPKGEILNEPISFTDQSTGSPIKYHWDFGDGNQSEAQHPVHQFIATGSYNVCLAVVNDIGCKDTTCQDIKVNIRTAIDVPGAFSPNGDGINDKLFVMGAGVKEFHFRIFNRWGEQIFETSDFNNGWDGSYRGDDQNLSVVAWTLNAVMINEEVVQKQGSITIIR